METSPMEEELRLRASEVVTITSSHRGGFGIPAHPFFRGLLYFYRVRLHDLTAYEIIHLAIFVALCERFLGVATHFALWRRLFQVELVETNGVPNRVGTAVIWLRLDTG